MAGAVSTHDMVHAYIMVTTGTGVSEATVEAIRSLPTVSEAHIIAGEYDIVTEVDVEEVYEVLHTAASAIQSLDGVIETRTYVALE